MPNREAAWTRESPDGGKVQVRAHGERETWRFHVRTARYEPWKELPEPLLEDWLQLLDSVQRKAQRNRGPRGEAERLLAHIRRLFPAADLDGESGDDEA